MKRISMLVLLSTLAVSAFASDPRQVVAAFSAALEQGDREKALSLLDPGVLIYEAGYVERSRDEYAAHHLGGDIEFAKAVKRKVLKESVHVDGNTAVLMEETETTGSFKGKDVHSFGTGTMVLARKGGNWLITHVHWSSRKPK